MSDIRPFANLNSSVFEAFSKVTDKQYIFICDVETNIWRWSPHAVDYFGLPGEYITDLPALWMERVHPEDRKRVARAFGDMFSGVAPEHSCEYRVKNGRGQYDWVLCRGCMVSDKEQNKQLCAGILTNLGQECKFDQVTGVFSGNQFLVTLKDQVCQKGAHGGVLMLGIDHFRTVNETHHRSFGDLLLNGYAKKLCSSVPSGSTVYRLGGDRFAVIYPNATEELLAEAFQTISRASNSGIAIRDTVIRLTITAGAVLYPENGTREEDIVANLEYAYETSKKYNREGLTFFTEDLRAEASRKRSLMQLLRESVKDGCRDFSVYFQPIVSADESHELVGAEALLRWSHHDFPTVSPVDFIPLLEESGDIKVVGRWVLTSAIEQVKKWQRIRPQMKISVNISYLQLLDKDFKFFVLEELERLDFPKEKLMLELTESCNVLHPAEMEGELKFFRDHGIQIALDDFGTGYASLSVLRDLTTDWIKVDHTFVANIAENNFDQALTQTIIDLCKRLNLEICVEGIENEEIERVIEGYCPTVLQGYYYSRPIPAELFELQYIAGIARPPQTKRMEAINK